MIDIENPALKLTMAIVGAVADVTALIIGVV